MPDTLERALDPGWLTAALRLRYPGVTVRSVERGPVVSRVSTNARFVIDSPDRPPELPAELCVKGYFRDCSDAPPGSGAAGIPEVQFYRRLAATSGVRTLACHYADIDDETPHGVIITEDVAAVGATFLDALSPFSPEQVADSLGQYAVLHGRSWGMARTDDSWLAPRLEMTMRARGLPVVDGNFDGPIGAGVPEDVRDGRRLLEAVSSLAQDLPGLPSGCLLHGDAHVGNLFLDAAGRSCLVDWQLVQRGPWYLDVGYHIGCTLDPEERRKNEEDLLAHYLDRLQAEGGDPPSWDSARRSIEVGMVYGFYLWAITLKVAPAVTAAMLERLGNAVSDHEAYGAVGSS